MPRANPNKPSEHFYRGREHRANLEFIARTPGKSEIKLMAEVLLLLMDARTQEGKDIAFWAKDHLSKIIKGDKTEDGMEPAIVPSSPWTFGK